MALAAAIAIVQATLDDVVTGGFANGDIYVNMATPSASHVRAYLRWPINDDGTARSVVDHVCRYTMVHQDTATRNGVADKADIETGVIIAVARAAAWKFYGWDRASLNAAEIAQVPAGEAALTVHADHEAAVAEAMAIWAVPAARYMGLFFYNSISYEQFNHHHQKAVSKKLATTTMALTGLNTWIAGSEEREGSVFHDMFHPVADVLKSAAARNVRAKDHLAGLRFDNLRKRIPVKAPDTGISVNYPVLLAKARAYRHTPEHLPEGLTPPDALAAAITAYQDADGAAALATAVDDLRTMAVALEEPSAYLAGFILGREAHAAGDNELDLRTASRTTTILGAPAYKRVAAEFSGTFAAGKENGFRNVAAGTPDTVLPRCTAAVASIVAAP